MSPCLATTVASAVPQLPAPMTTYRLHISLVLLCSHLSGLSSFSKMLMTGSFPCEQSDLMLALCFTSIIIASTIPTIEKLPARMNMRYNREVLPLLVIEPTDIRSLITSTADHNDSAASARRHQQDLAPAALRMPSRHLCRL